MTKRACQCETDWLKRHIEGRLDEREQDRLATHIESCEECRNALDALAGDQTFWRDLRDFLAHEPQFSSAARRQARKPDGDAQTHGSRQEWTGCEAILTVLDPPTDSSSIGSLGAYQILEVIGRGGMGLVLKGLDPVLRRIVAIKVLAPELSYLGSARLRFAREARAAASVAHEHVVAIHAVDSAQGLPYLVMQYVAGTSLQQRIEQKGPLAVQEILRIAMQTASGLAAAHAQGLVHRDIKPANILLENGIERVQITDFGLARAADDVSLSQSGVAAGTPHYMSPEQARCEPIDHRADLFGLGGVMYAMCTGRPPFRGGTALAVLRGVCDDPPRPIRTDRPEVPAWLEGIIAKLLAKDPAARFQTAEEVVTLLGQCLVYLEHPTEAPPFPVHPDRRLGDVRNWRSAAFAVIALVCGFGPVAVAFRIGALDAWFMGLPRPSDAFPGAPADRLQVGSTVLDALWRVPVSCHEPITPWPLGAVDTVAFSPNGTDLAVACGDGSVALCSTRTSRLRAILGTHPERVWSLAYSPDGSTLAAAGGNWARGTHNGFVTLWDGATGRELARLAHACETELAVAFSPNGKILASGGRDRVVKLWDVETGRVRALCRGHDGAIRALAFHPREERLVSAAFDATIRVWNTATAQQEGDPIRLAGRSSNCVAIAPDGSTFVTSTGPRSDDPGWGDPSPGLLQVWMWKTRQQKFVLEGHRYPILGVSFSPDGKTLASAGGYFADGGEVKLWDTSSGREHMNLTGHKWWVECVAFSPDSLSLVSAGGYENRGGEVRIWDLRSQAEPGGG
jgi:serine/threonine protein kinase/WD40 repeat protein